MKPRLGALFAVCIVAQAQTFEQPRQQFDLYGGGSYRVGVDRSAAPVIGAQIRGNIGSLVGIGGYYNYSREFASFGASASGSEVSSSLNIHDYGAVVEVHCPSRLQPYLLGTFGWITAQVRASDRNYERDIHQKATESHFAYGGGVGVRFHFNRRLAVFAESRLMRPAVWGSDYFVRGTVGLTIGLP